MNFEWRFHKADLQ